MSMSTDSSVYFSPTLGEEIGEAMGEAIGEAMGEAIAPVGERAIKQGRARISAEETDRGSILKYKADRGPVAYVLGMLIVHLVLWWIASPLVAALLVVPLAISSMFIAPINHHHQHLNTFRSAWVNRLYDLALALQTGIAPYGWTLHHNLGHHLNYLNQYPHTSPDESAWTRLDGAQMGRIEYTIDMLLRHQSDMYRVGQKHRRYRRYWLLMKLPLYTLIGVGLWINPINTLLIFLVPGFVALTHTIWATYEHHAGCETDNHLVGSRNRDNRIYNWMTGNLGLHTAHHKRPGVHWSLLPQLHEEIKHEIPDELILGTFW
jgi:fatty acid desaturase